MAIADRARDAVRRAQEAAQKGAEQAREKGQTLALRRRLSAQAEELGHIVFRQQEGEGGLDAEVQRLVAEMRRTRDELEREAA